MTQDLRNGIRKMSKKRIVRKGDFFFGERSEGEALLGSRGIPLQVSISPKWYNLLHHSARYSVHDSIVYMVYIPNGEVGRGGVLVRNSIYTIFSLYTIFAVGEHIRHIKCRR